MTEPYVPKDPEKRLTYVREIQEQQGWTDETLLEMTLNYAVLDERFVMYCEDTAEYENEESEEE